MRRIFMVLASSALLAAGGVQAQTAMAPQRHAAPEQKSEVRVQVNVSFFVPGVASGSEESLKAQEQARRSIYESAARECEVLRSALASACRLESLGVNINRGYGQPHNEGFTATRNFTFKVTLK